jgi:hypothetical protein
VDYAGGMKKTPLVAWQRQYAHLRQRLARVGYISQGSVVDRSRLKTPRSGYQWTRKLARKTITVALNREQFLVFRQAIQNRRTVAKTLREMEKLSRRILFATRPDTHRRKKLDPNALGLN